MKLYHFTAAELLPQIMEEGLSRGDIPITPTVSWRGVWLTTSCVPEGHGLGEERELTPKEKALLGIEADRPVRMLNKRRMRIEVLIPQGDRNLLRWDRWSKKRLDSRWRDALHKTDGGQFRTWFIYKGIIPPGCFLKVEDLQALAVAA